MHSSSGSFFNWKILLAAGGRDRMVRIYRVSAEGSANDDLLVPSELETSTQTSIQQGSIYSEQCFSRYNLAAICFNTYCFNSLF